MEDLLSLDDPSGFDSAAWASDSPLSLRHLGMINAFVSHPIDNGIRLARLALDLLEQAHAWMNGTAKKKF